MPQLADDVIRGAIREQEDMQLVDSHAADQLLAGERIDTPDVLIVELDGAAIPAFCAPLLYGNPYLKVLAVSTTGHDTALYELRPHKVALGNVTASGLMDAIRSSCQENK